MHVIDDVILVGWLVFWVYWFVSAIGVKAGNTRLTRFAGLRVAVGLLIFLLLRLRLFRGHALTGDALAQAIGLALFLLGLALAVWARLYLGRNWGMPMTEKADPELVRTGPYRFVRHPIYSGIILAVVGTALAVSVDLLIVAALLSAYFVYSAVVEERNMTRLFPGAYPDYKRSTKMLLPFIF